MPAAIGSGTTQQAMEQSFGKDGPWDPQMWEGRAEGRLKPVFYCSTKEKAGGLVLGEKRERRSAGRKPIWFSGKHGQWLSRGCMMELRVGV